MTAALDLSDRLRCTALGDPEDSFPTAHAPSLMPDNDDEPEATLTTPAPPPIDKEADTNPANEIPVRRDALNPPGPELDDLATSQLASKEPPEWFSSSFIGHALSAFADDARAIREGRDQQHREQMRQLHEIQADNKLIRGEVQAFRRATEARDADHDKQLDSLRREVGELRQRVDEQGRQLAEQEQRLAVQKASLEETNRSIALAEERLNAARTAQAATSPAEQA